MDAITRATEGGSMKVFIEDPCFKTLSIYDNIEKVYFTLFTLRMVAKNGNEYTFHRPQLFDFRIEEEE